MKRILLFCIPFLLTACGNNGHQADAYGNFEAEERIISSEANGRILQLLVEEGKQLKAGQLVGFVDSSQLLLQRAQLEASAQSLPAKTPAINEQLAVFDRQIDAAEKQRSALKREQQRLENLLKQDAATPKQLDEINDQLDMLEKQMAVTREQRKATFATLSSQTTGILSERGPLEKQIDLVNDQIGRCRLVNPVTGTVLVQYAEAGEVIAFGKPLYKLANMDTLTFRAYMAGDQLSRVQTGQTVTVRIDAPDDTYIDYSGKITWIAPDAEFTPKVIQTKDERVNLVYALKVRVPNDGRIKIGMPGELLLGQDADGQD